MATSSFCRRWSFASRFRDRLVELWDRGITTLHRPAGAGNSGHTANSRRCFLALESLEERQLLAAPFAASYVANTTLNAPVYIFVLKNDTDPQGLALSVSGIGSPPAQHGSTLLTVDQVTGQQEIKYTPFQNYSGSDSFGYTITDGQAQSGSASGLVSITVSSSSGAALPDVVTANAQGPLQVQENGFYQGAVTGSDTNNVSLTYSPVPNFGPGHGTLNLSPSGSFTYTPTPGYSGSDQFTFQAKDSQGVSANANVSIQVLPTATGNPTAAN